MASIFSKNAVLAGRIDHYCLICAELFTNEEDTLAHIVDGGHKEKLKACGYFEKYKDDFIRKAQGVYFCEPCSLIFPTATKVELHTHEQGHLIEKNKITPNVKRVGNYIVAYNKYIITDDAWNGCIEDTCFLCNTEFDDSTSHKAVKSHVFNLIKSEVIFDNIGYTVYRTIDANTKQCLTCNEIIGNDQRSHFLTVEHRNAYKLYDNSIQTTEIKSATEDSKTAVTAEPNNSLKVNATNGNVNEGLKNETGGKKSSKDIKKNVTKDEKGVTKDTKDVKKNASNDAKKDSKKETTKTVDKEKVKEKPLQTVNKENAEELDKIYCKNLGAINYITGGTGEKWCILCEWLLVDSPEDHIRSKHHKNLLKLHKERLAEKNNNVPSKDEESNLYESVDKYQNSNVNIDLINEIAFCKKCSRNIDFNTKAIDKHIEEHKKATTSSKKPQEILNSGIKSNGTNKTTLFTKPVLLGKDKRSRKTVSVGDYAKKHGLTYNRADGSYYCHPCSRRLPSVLDDLQKHIASKIHTENMKESSTAPPPIKVKVPLFDFIKSIEIGQTNTNETIIIINEKYWLNAFGFFLIAKNKDGKIFCQGCHIDLTQENVCHHLVAHDNHIEIVKSCQFITSLENEFITEISLDVYHCGYCTTVVKDWDDVLDHITIEEHKRRKLKAEQCLRDHQPNTYNRVNVKDIGDMIQQFSRHHMFSTFR